MKAIVGLAVLAILAAVGDAAAGGLVPRSLGPTTSAVVTIEKSYAAGTIVIVSGNRTLDLVISEGRAIRYKIGVGRDGFRWSGTVKVGRKAEWPDWRPPVEMKARAAGLPDLVPAGPLNPLGARGIYLYKGGTDTLYRIHEGVRICPRGVASMPICRPGAGVAGRVLPASRFAVHPSRVRDPGAAERQP